MGSPSKPSLVALSAALAALGGVLASSLAKKAGGFSPAEVAAIVDENAPAILASIESAPLALSAFKEAPIDAAEVCVAFVVNAACDVLGLESGEVAKSDLVEAIGAIEAVTVTFLSKLKDGFQPSDVYLSVLQNTGALRVGIEGIENVGEQVKANARGQILASVSSGFGLFRQLQAIAG